MLIFDKLVKASEVTNDRHEPKWMYQIYGENGEKALFGYAKKKKKTDLIWMRSLFYCSFFQQDTAIDMNQCDFFLSGKNGNNELYSRCLIFQSSCIIVIVIKS